MPARTMVCKSQIAVGLARIVPDVDRTQIVKLCLVESFFLAGEGSQRAMGTEMIGVKPEGRPKPFACLLPAPEIVSGNRDAVRDFGRWSSGKFLFQQESGALVLAQRKV